MTESQPVSENKIEEKTEEVEDWKLQAEDFKSSGNEAFKKGSWQEAVDWYTKAIELDPDDRVYYSNRSAAYLKLGDSKSKALKDAEKCVELGKDWAKAYSRLGAAQCALRRYDAAIDSYKIGLNIEPDNSLLKEGLAAAEAGKEQERKVRWETAKIEEKMMEAERKAEEEAKQRKLKSQKSSSVPVREDEDVLTSFFNEVSNNAPVSTQKKVQSNKYTAQELGSAKDQISRLTSQNYKWINLNPYEVLQLDTDATLDDIKYRYRKLSTLVHPDKQLHTPLAREAFEEVKKAYHTLLEEEKKDLCVATIEAVRTRVAKERARLEAKGINPRALEAEYGNAEEHKKKAIMKEFANIEMRRREIEEHKQAQKQREQAMEEEEQEKLKAMSEREKKWNEETGREKRMDSWRSFAGTGKAPKKAKMWKEEERSAKPGTREKFAIEDANSYKKKWM